jgi:hypothetical protein
MPIAAWMLACSLQASAREPKLYPLDDGSVPAQPEAIVRVQRGFSGPAVLLLSFDGKDPRSFPSMSAYAETVRKAEAGRKPGQKPGLVNVSPAHNEPQMVGVTPGSHAYGVLFITIDTARKGLFSNEIAHTLADKYMPIDALPSDDPFITAKHYEELTFSAQPGKRYLIQYVWNKDAADLHFSVSECPESWKDCTLVPFDSAKTQTVAQPGVGAQEIGESNN